MYNHEPKDYVCPFCNLVRGVEQGKKHIKLQDIVFQDKFVTAFISGKWWPKNSAHVIIIPNKHIENIYDITKAYSHKIADLSRLVAIGLKEIYKCDGVSTRQHNEPEGNQEVWHYHMHVFPRYKHDNLYINHLNSYWVTSDEKSPYAEKLRKYFDRLKLNE